MEKCKNKKWEACCICAKFDECDYKENYREGTLTVLSGDFRKLIKRITNFADIEKEFDEAEDDSALVTIRGMKTGKIFYKQI